MVDDTENLLEHVKILATSDGRAMGTPGHKRARKYLCAVLQHLGMQPYAGETFELVTTTGAEELVNIIAVAPGKNGNEPPILIGAHYDTFGSLPGADDNAAAIAIALEIGRALSKSPAACDVVLAFFDSEEWGYLNRASMGSTRFYEDQYTRPARCAFIMDLVGHNLQIKELANAVIVTGMESSSSWAPFLKQAEPEHDLRWVTKLNSYRGSLSDHYVFDLNKVPYLFFTCGRWEHYHQATDTFEKLSYSNMALLKDALLTLVCLTAETDLKTDPYDSTMDEIFFLRKNVLPRLGTRESQVSSRADIDELLSSLAAQFPTL